MTVGEFRRQTLCDVNNIIADEAEIINDILLSVSLGCDRAQMLLRLDSEITDESMSKFQDMFYELTMGVPVQYIVGSCWFYNQEIKIGKGCFIPRYDTEFLAAAAITALPVNGLFADICSGSGCISAAIGKTLKAKKGFALELSNKALQYTETNLEQYENIKVKRFDALDPDDYISLRNETDELLDIIVSNPPYIPTQDIDGLSTQVKYEPENALDGGGDGLRFYREIILNAPIILKDNGTILFEVGINQADDVAELLKNAGYSVAMIKDDQKIDRVVLGSKA